ncbi:hypothetical protein EUGRSUZ_B03459 [Eucalyptus grandis]|uniref:Uncharacterized protein n=3 Tax=Eucalyptus TaxID=3932 RepID=A0ACC3LX82_EUCGR|nr:hypothetical protein EUGRSUZ_B03459 [Eucalyptus grandis]
MELLATISPWATLQTFFLAFLLVYLFSYFLLFGRWGPRSRPFASSCFTSLAHGTPAAVTAAIATRGSPPPWHRAAYASPNTALHDTVLEFSIAYFLIDLIHYLVFFPSDVLFIIHHLVTLFVLLTCRYVVAHGAHAILLLLILAEVTSPCQNTWSLAKARKAEAPFAARFFRVMSPIFFTFYTVVRGVVAPAYVCDLVMYYSMEDVEDSIPKWAWVSWAVIMGSGILVSLLWVLNNWKVWYRDQRSFDVQKKDG